MRLHYRVIQFVADPFRGEGRNVAVIAHDGSRAYLRAIGLTQDGRMDISYFETLADKEQHAPWVYGEWINWFRDLTQNEGRNQERLDLMLEQLTAQGIHFQAQVGNILEITDSEDSEKAMDWLFGRVVGPVRRPPGHTFDEHIEDLLKRSEILYREGFMRDVEVDIAMDTGMPYLTLAFPFFLESGVRLGFKVVRNHASLESYRRQVNDAIYTFEKAQERKLLGHSHCLVLTETPAHKDKTPVLRQLSQLATVVDVHSDRSPDLIHQLATGTH